MKKLGFGLMRLPTFPEGHASGAKAGEIDIEHMKKMVDAFLAEGFTYFDTAWMYCNFRSENAAKEALVDRYPRESFTLADKLHAAYLKSKDDRDAIFNEQLRKTGVEYFDYYMLHDMRVAHEKIYNDLDCFAWIRDKKEKGLVKEIGFSFHDNAAFLDKVLTEHPEMDFVQLQINYLDWESDAVQSRLCYEVARKHGKPIVVMEPVKGGTLANLPAGASRLLKQAHPELSEASWAVRFAAGLPGVRVVLSGMSSDAQMKDNLSYMKEFTPLTDGELQLLARVANWVRSGIAIPCTGCSYCTTGCPVSISIPDYFALYNRGDAAKREEYLALNAKGGAPADCIGCGACEAVCPQELPIREELQAVAKRFA